MVKIKRILQEGDFTNGFFYGKFSRNKNVIWAITGPTGSGKSYSCLRMAELWYDYALDKPFPAENICFSNGEIMHRLSSGTLQKGEMLILEESGVNLNSSDFQNRTSKMFNFVMQSFRSMNIGLLLNLPVLTMLNKSCRQLIHAHLITSGINQMLKTCKLKPFLHQLNQGSGKSYWKYPRVKVEGRSIVLQRINSSLPSPELIKAYEAKKQKFLLDLTSEYSAEYDKLEADKIKKQSRKDLTRLEQEVFDELVLGLTMKEIAIKRGSSYENVRQARERMERKGYYLGKQGKQALKPKQTAV